MKALITGTSGFIGGHLLLALAKREEFKKIVYVNRKSQDYPWDINETVALQGINCNLTHDISVASLMKRYQPDVIFHLAGISTVKSGANPFEVTQTNVLSTHHLLEYAPEGCKFVLASSATVYGDYSYNTSVWAKEDTYCLPTSVYAASKLAAEKLVEVYNKQERVQGLIFRLAATVGSGATHGVVPDVIKKIKSDSHVLSLLGDSPGSSKPYTHVEDVVNGLIKLSLNENAKGIINLSNDDYLSIKFLAEIVQKTIIAKKPLSWMGKSANWIGDNPLVKIDNCKAVKLGWERKYPTSESAIIQATKDILSSERNK